MLKNNLNKFSNRKVSTMMSGIGQIVIGITVVIIAAFTTWVNVLGLGFIFAMWGGVDLLMSIRDFESVFASWRLALGFFAFGIGILLLTFPFMSMAQLSSVLSIFFIAGGLYKVIIAIADRIFNWGYIALSGMLSMILGFFLFSQLPVDSFLLLNGLVGVEIIVNGWSLMVVGYFLGRRNQSVVNI
jgi:uncharacterized membrane protein HdeD (DUF308 family)